MLGSCTGAKIIEYAEGADLPTTSLWLYDSDGATLIDFGSGFTFAVDVIDDSGTVAFASKTTGIVGAAGSGASPDGVPNVVITWADGEIDSLDAGRYTFRLTATTSGKSYIYQSILRIKSRIAAKNWTYTHSPATSQVDEVRLLIGDTNEDDPLLSNEEIEYFIATEGPGKRAASEAARAIASSFARLMDRSIGSLSASYSQKYQQYFDLSQTLKTEAQSDPVSPYVSGWKRSEKDIREQDLDREELFAKKTGMDNPTIGNPDDYGYRVRGY
jgi:hypothetical protein